MEEVISSQDKINNVFTTTPSLDAGNPVRNTLVTLVTQLNRIERVPESLPTYNAESPRVEPTTLTKHTSLPTPDLRVVVHPSSH